MSNKKEDQIQEAANTKQIEKLSKKMDTLGVAEYVEMVTNPKKMIMINFVLGLARGLGMGIGFTILAGIVMYLLRSWVNLPFVGKLIADLIDIIEAYR